MSAEEPSLDDILPPMDSLVADDQSLWMGFGEFDIGQPLDTDELDNVIEELLSGKNLL